MDGYSSSVERQPVRLYRSLNERDRRRHAAVEAAKQGHGGLEYVSRLLGCDPKTIRQGIAERDSDQALDTDGRRKQGADANR